MDYHQSSFYEALKELQREHAILIAKGDRIKIWSPGHPVDVRLRRAVYRHKREVLKLLDLSEITTCPDPELHSHSWSYELNRECCNVCRHLKPHVS